MPVDRPDIGTEDAAAARLRDRSKRPMIDPPLYAVSNCPRGKRGVKAPIRSSRGEPSHA